MQPSAILSCFLLATSWNASHPTKTTWTTTFVAAVVVSTHTHTKQQLQHIRSRMSLHQMWSNFLELAELIHELNY